MSHEYLTSHRSGDKMREILALISPPPHNIVCVKFMIFWYIMKRR